ISYSVSVSNQQLITSTFGQVTGTVLLSKIVNSSLHSALDMFSLIGLTFVFDNVPSSFMEGFTTVMNSLLGVSLEGVSAIIVLVVLSVFATGLIVFLYRCKAGYVIVHALYVTAASFMCIPAVHIIDISKKDIHNVMYCCNEIGIDGKCPFELSP